MNLEQFNQRASVFYYSNEVVKHDELPLHWTSKGAKHLHFTDCGTGTKSAF